MRENIVFNAISTFKSAAYNMDSDTWYFYFDKDIYISSSGFWRLLIGNRIILVSLDHGHQFGHAQPIDLQEKLNNRLTGKILTEINVDKSTADLTLTISGDIKIQIFISSSGYETYEFHIANNRYIGLGSGNVGIVEPTDNPQVFKTRQL